MSPSGVVSTARARGENRFYVTPAMRKQQQQQQLQQQQQQQKPVASKNCVPEIDKRAESNQCGYSNCSVSGRFGPDCNSSNLDRFLEYTTPVVCSQLLPKTCLNGFRNGTVDHHRYFVLGDLWESFKEWSAYGAGVPLLLNESETVMQYYVPFLSGIQLYVDPLRSSSMSRKRGEESDAESSRETSSDVCSDCGVERGVNNGLMAWCQLSSADANFQNLNKLSPCKTHRSSSSEECELPYPTGHLVFQYMEQESPFARQPLADKISVLSSQFPEIKTYRSCDLSPASWISVAWYPIYRIPMGPTLQSLDACFLTFHSLSTPLQRQSNAGIHFPGAGIRNSHSSKLLLPTFGLASYKLKVSFWNPEGANDCQKINSLLQDADNWLKQLKVHHPDYSFFISRNSTLS